jgi:hypothetical protein
MKGIFPKDKLNDEKTSPHAMQAIELMGTAPASGAVRRAVAPNTKGLPVSIVYYFIVTRANREGAVGCARGWRGPHSIWKLLH